MTAGQGAATADRSDADAWPDWGRLAGPLPTAVSVSEPGFHARLSVGQHTGAYDVVRLAFAERQIDGTEPFAAECPFPGTADPDDLLPVGARIVRSATNGTSRAVLARVPGGTVLLLLHRDTSVIGVTAPTADGATVLLDRVRDRVPTLTPPDTVPVHTWYSSGDRTVRHTRDLVAPEWADVVGNYPAVVREPLEHLQTMTAPSSGGKLILWHGRPGTGKTTALRALMRSWVPWCEAHYIADPERFFALPGYIAEVVGETRPGPAAASPPWRLLIAEDCDEYLRATARRDAGAGLGRLLNLADGVLGQGYRTLVLLTTNEDLRHLHPAVIRPGRCLAHVEFVEFSRTEARDWLPPDVADPAGPCTLAELYALRDGLTPIATAPPPAPAPAPGQYL